MALAACSEQEPETVEVTRIVEVPVEVASDPIEVTREVTVEVPVEVSGEPAVSIPYEEQWMASAHADAAAEAFVHWNEDDPAEVPTSCAKCHSTPGFVDFLGADGSEFGVVDQAAEIGSVIECEACHNSVTPDLTSVVFASGAEISGLDAEARCMQCHQGRASTVQVNESIAGAGLAEGDEDTVSEDLGFTNIHYFAAAATQFGTLAMGGYEYDGKSYDAKFDHVAPYNTCVNCHNPHTLEVEFEECTGCHTDLDSPEDLVDIRMAGSLVDYDGDGDMTEGVYFRLQPVSAGDEGGADGFLESLGDRRQPVGAGCQCRGEERHSHGFHCLDGRRRHGLPDVFLCRVRHCGRPRLWPRRQTLSSRGLLSKSAGVMELFWNRFPRSLL
jgi:hypothetical protein